MVSDLVAGLMENRWYCSDCGKEYTPIIDASSKEEAELCTSCYKKHKGVMMFIDEDEARTILNLFAYWMDRSPNPNPISERQKDLVKRIFERFPNLENGNAHLLKGNYEHG